jgi:cytochrome c oxidase accessory protein FixG
MWGFWRNKRAVIAYILMFVYLGLPWLTINGKQAVLINLLDRKLTLFGATFWATDTYFLALILALLGISLFFFTSLLGRVWCGWACPETVFLEFLFRPIEELIEGGPAKRLRLDTMPEWNSEKIIRKTLKFFVFALLVWILSSTAVIYFVGRENWLQMIVESPLHNWTPFILTIIMMVVFGFQFGWFREQFCTVLCPYARFQSVLLDQHSIIVGYDVARGEPRGKKGTVDGDCVDCNLCVKVCPTGIDIRNGLQLECIHCAACVDACDSVMNKIGRDTGLIRYDSTYGFTNSQLATEKRQFNSLRNFIRPRTIYYSLLGTVLLTIFVFSLFSRPLTDFQILRNGENPYKMIKQGHVSNHLHAQVGNKSDRRVNYTFELLNQSPETASLELVVPVNPYPINHDTVVSVPLFINFPENVLQKGRFKVDVKLTGDNGDTQTRTVTLLGPG